MGGGETSSPSPPRGVDIVANQWNNRDRNLIKLLLGIYLNWSPPFLHHQMMQRGTSLRDLRGVLGVSIAFEPVGVVLTITYVFYATVRSL